MFACGMRRVKGREPSFGVFLLAALAALPLVSCGIPSSPYLPPVPATSVESPLVSETNYYFSIPDPATINPEIFEGFEIYYKLFDPQTIDDALEAGGDASLSSPVSLTSLKNAGYQRIASTLETASSLPDYPLIPLTGTDMQNKDLRITLEFSNISNKPRSVYGNIFFSRTLKNASGARVLKGFSSSDFAADDSDLPPDFDPSSRFDDVTIALYVMSYGNDYQYLSFNIHSTAVYLGNSKLVLLQ